MSTREPEQGNTDRACRSARRSVKIRRGIAVTLLLALGLGLQILFFERFPQPELFGDPAGYQREGARLRVAASRVISGQSLGDIGRSLSGSLLFAGAGAFFAVVDALRPNDLAFDRIVLAGFNTLGMLGAFLLARRLAGSFRGGLMALSIAAIHPSFSTHTPRLYPDPVTCALFVWAAYFYLRGLQANARAWMAVAGFTLTTGLFIRAQIMTYVLILLAIAIVASSLLWWQRRDARRLASALAIGCLPLAVLWGFILSDAQTGIRSKVAEDNFALKQLYPYGFWQFLETDGWEGPYRLRTEPFYRAMEAAALESPSLLTERRRQWAFTARYVLARPRESLQLVLDNAYRLYDRHANPYRWDYPFPVSMQTALHRGVVILAVAALAAFGAESLAHAGVFFLPLALALLHGLAFPWPRYG